MPSPATWTELYLPLMGHNACQADAALIARVVATASSLAVADVIELLRGSWRPRAVGAWLALRFDSPALDDELRSSLKTSGGAYTAIPLATALVVKWGARARPTLEHYLATDLASGLGAAPIIHAAIAACDEPAAPIPSNAHAQFDRLREVARAIAAAPR